MRKLPARAGWVLAGLFALTLAAAWAGVIDAGLDPPGVPGPTMKSLDEIPGSWSRLLPSTGGCDSERFDCVLASDEGVLDRETGLVWDRAPAESTLDWDTAVRSCHDRDRGGRLGWRLAAVSELLSLLDAESVDGLPAGHPFAAVGANDTFWSSTRNTASAGRAMRVHLEDASVVDELIASAHRAWCVRAPAGGDVQ